VITIDRYLFLLKLNFKNVCLKKTEAGAEIHEVGAGGYTTLQQCLKHDF
jgi:hypothetical protein